MPNLCVAPPISIMVVDLPKQINTKNSPLREIQGSCSAQSVKMCRSFFNDKVAKTMYLTKAGQRLFRITWNWNVKQAVSMYTLLSRTKSVF